MASKIIHIQYFAALREQRGLSSEDFQTNASNAQELFEELKLKFHFKIPSNLLKIAINNEFSNWSNSIKSGDSIVFIPPVAGG